MDNVQRRMDELQREGRPNTKPVGSPYTLVAPGVAAMSVGTGPLNASAVIANDTPGPFVLDLQNHVAEAANPTQRVLLYEVTIADRGQVDRNLLNATGEELAQLGANAAFKWLPESAIGKRLSIRSVAMGKIIFATPFLGNVIAAFEVGTGYEWTEWFKPEAERQPMGTGERFLGLAGTIPGAGSLTKVFGKEAIRAAAMKAAQLVDRRGVWADGAGVVAGDWAEAVYDRAHAAYTQYSGPVVEESAAQVEPIARQAYLDVMSA